MRYPTGTRDLGWWNRRRSAHVDTTSGATDVLPWWREWLLVHQASDSGYATLPLIHFPSLTEPFRFSP